MPTRASTRKTRRIYEFIKANRNAYDVRTMCRALDVTRSGFYAWLKRPLSDRAREDARLLGLIKASFVASHGIYGARRVFLDLREAGETCSKHRVARLMRINNIRAGRGYRVRRQPAAKASVLIPNVLQRRFDVSAPNKAWVTDITYVRTWEGWLYLAVVVDLFSRKVVGWAARPTLSRELALDAVLMAVKRRKPRHAVIHSDQGTQYGSDDWRRFCKRNHLEPSMSRKGNCWDNAVAESFFHLLKTEWVNHHRYVSRSEAISSLFYYIEIFYNRKRRHSVLDYTTPQEYETFPLAA